MNESQNPEEAVRRYLNWLEDPDSAVDQEAIESARRAFLAEGDPIARLRAAAALEAAKSADVDEIVAQFVANARAYADAEEIPVEAFRALKVPDDVLAKAGFTLPPTGRGRSRRSGRRGGSRPSVSVAALKQTVPSMPTRFTLSELADRAGGGSPGTVKKAVEELIAEGSVTRIGPDPDHAARGRAPIIYEHN